MTQVEIAKKLNVSQGLISLILNNPETPSIPEKKKQEILDFIKKVGYQPRDRKKNPKLKIGYITCQQGTYARDFYEPYLAGLGDAAKEFSAELSYMSYSPDEINAIENVNDISGYIVQSSYLDNKIPFLKKENTVFLNHSVTGFDCVMPDNINTISVATEHLVNNGHTRIAYWTMWNSKREGSSKAHQSERLEGFYSSMRDFGLEYGIGHAYIFEVKDSSFEEIRNNLRQTFTQWQSLKDRPTAVIAGDAYALLMMNIASEFDVSIPGDLSIIGYDNGPACEFSNPPLTSVEQNRKEMGYMSLELLLSRLNRPHALPRRLMCPPALVKRKSVMDLNKKK